jgi:hypothetical protein
MHNALTSRSRRSKLNGLVFRILITILNNRPLSGNFLASLVPSL